MKSQKNARKQSSIQVAHVIGRSGLDHRSGHGQEKKGVGK